MFKATKGKIIGKSSWTINDVANKGDKHTMFLTSAPLSKRYGHLQPKTYLEVNENNSSQFINAHADFGAKSLSTVFQKVAIRIVRLKSLKFKEEIDCSDTFYSTTNGPDQKGVCMLMKD